MKNDTGLLIAQFILSVAIMIFMGVAVDRLLSIEERLDRVERMMGK